MIIYLFFEISAVMPAQNSTSILVYDDVARCRAQKRKEGLLPNTK